MWSSTQQSHVVRDTVARVFSLPAAKIRFIKPYVGGAFGHKTGLNTNETMAILGSKRTGKTGSDRPLETGRTRMHRQPESAGPSR